MTSTQPLLYFDAVNGILATPVAYNLSANTAFARLRTPLPKTAAYATPAACLNQCTKGNPAECLLARYDLGDPTPLNVAVSRTQLGITCENIRKERKDGEQRPVQYRFKFAEDRYGVFGWIPEAKVVPPPPEGGNVTASSCFSACDLAASCWVATYDNLSATCTHYPMANATAQPPTAWWLWEAHKDFKVDQVPEVRNLTEEVRKVLWEKGVDNPSGASLGRHSGVGLVQAVIALAIVVCQVV